MKLEWIKKLNEMYNLNSCTDSGRVKVGYCEACDCVNIKVFDKTVTIDAEPFTCWGLLKEINKAVNMLYEDCAE